MGGNEGGLGDAEMEADQGAAVGPTGPLGEAGQTRVAYWEEYDHEVQALEVQEQQNQVLQPRWLHNLQSLPVDVEPSLHLLERWE